MFSNTYHLFIQTFSRRTSSCAAVLAYRVGFRLRDPHDGLVKYPHRKRGDIESHFIMNWTVPGRSAGTQDLYQAILDEIGMTETRINSRMFREFVTAMPHEGTNKRRSNLTERFAGALSRGFGITTIVGQHLPPDEVTDNYHCHILGLLRAVDRSDGQPRLKGKVRKLDARKTVKAIRRLWQKMVNGYYRDLGIDKTVSCESYKTLGFDQIPTIHEGPGARIKNGERPQINKAIRERNKTRTPGLNSSAPGRIEAAKARKALKKERAELNQQIKAVKERIRHNLESATLNSRQKKQVADLKKYVAAAIAECGSAKEISEHIKDSYGRGTVGKNVYYRLRNSLPPAGGDHEVQYARDGVELLALLFETGSDDDLKKLKRWASGITHTVSAKSVNLNDPFVLERLRVWEILAEEDKQASPQPPPPPPAGAGEMKIGT
jgi:hypothetical protein